MDKAKYQAKTEKHEAKHHQANGNNGDDFGYCHQDKNKGTGLAGTEEHEAKYQGETEEHKAKYQADNDKTLYQAKAEVDEAKNQAETEEHKAKHHQDNGGRNPCLLYQNCHRAKNEDTGDRHQTEAKADTKANNNEAKTKTKTKTSGNNTHQYKTMVNTKGKRRRRGRRKGDWEAEEWGAPTSRDVITANFSNTADFSSADQHKWRVPALPGTAKI